MLCENRIIAAISNDIEGKIFFVCLLKIITTDHYFVDQVTAK
jgi:hypothetical protein